MTSTPSRSTPGTPTANNVQPHQVNHPAYKILQNAYNNADASSIFTDKVRNKPLLLAPSHQNITTQDTPQILASRDKSKRALRRHIRLRKKQYYLQHRKPCPLSAKEKRELKIYDIAPDEIRYDVYRGLNRLWTGYLLEVLGLTSQTTETTTTTTTIQPGSSTKQQNHASSNTQLSAGSSSSSSTTTIPTTHPTPTSHTKATTKPNQAKPTSEKTISATSHGSLLASLDYHGMAITVTQSSDITRVGLRGIIVRETRSTFVIVTIKNKVVKIPKKGSVFRVVVDLDSPFAALDDSERTIAGDTTFGEKEVGDGGEGKNTMIEAKEDEGEKIHRRLVFDLNGSLIEMRPFERAVKKFKWKRS